MAEQAQGLLAGIKVLDVTMSLTGPAAAMHLADFSADVIKVERPGRGDDVRRRASGKFPKGVNESPEPWL